VSTVIVTGSVRVRLGGILPPGLAARAVFCVCQKIASRPLTCVKTNWERARWGTVEHEVDRRPAPTAEQHRRLLDDLGLLRPWLLEAVTVDARGRRPQLARLQHQPAVERQPQQIGQLAVFLRVTPDDERRRSTLAAHAAA